VLVIPALGRLWWEDLEFQTNLGYIAKNPVSEKKKKMTMRFSLNPGNNRT
jgi:hypothetical protein